MYKDKKMRERVLKAANSKGVKIDYWLPIRIVTAICLAGIALAIWGPGAYYWFDSLNPYYQAGCIITFGIAVFVVVKMVTK